MWTDNLVKAVHCLVCVCVCRLIHDRELALYDGTRLLQAERYDEIKKKNNLSDEAMLAR